MTGHPEKRRGNYAGRPALSTAQKANNSAEKRGGFVVQGSMLRGMPILVLAGLLALSACAEKPAPAPPAGVAVAKIDIAPEPLPPLPPLGGDEKFQAFIKDFEVTAMARGVTPVTYNRAVAGIVPIATIDTIIAEQPEFVRPVWDYVDHAVSERRIADAKRLLEQNAAILNAIEARSGVPKEVLVAIWGMETEFGREMGSYNLFAALATEAAYDGPRTGYARRELISAMLLLQQNDYTPAEMVSSWAGAFGQTQFMPSTFFRYATDGDGDGKIDLWHSTADALASTATLFQREGWQPGKPWGYEVKLPKNFNYQDADLFTVRPLSDWAAKGVKLWSGAVLPDGDDGAALYLPAGVHGPALLTLNNFRQIMKYNNAASYALSVSLLADRMMGRPGIQGAWPRKEKLLSRADRLRFQTDLAALGYDAGDLDGLLGRKTRMALRQYQTAHGLPADAYPTADILILLDSDASKAKPTIAGE
jgi:membrane-bound lytic murein transglycosylase B